MGFDYYTRTSDGRQGYGDGEFYFRRNIFGASRLATAVVELGMGFDVFSYGLELPRFPRPEEFDVERNPEWDGDEDGIPEWIGDRAKEYRTAVDYVLDWHGISDIPGIPVHKICYSNDGWHVTQLECEAALGIYRARIAAGDAHPEVFYDDFIPFLELCSRHEGFESW